MPQTIRLFVAAASLSAATSLSGLGSLSGLANLSVAALPAAFVLPALVAAPGAALAQAADQGEAPKQVALTQALIDSLLAAQPDMSVVQEKAQAAKTDQPNPKAEAQMEAIAKKHGFASLAAYEEAADTVGIVLAGMDPETKTYIGPVAIIKKQMAMVRGDKTLPPKDKAETLKEMNEALATAGDNKPAPGNTEIVAKNYDKLSEGFQAGGGE